MDIDKSKVGVIIVTFNSAKDLVRLFNSLVNQSYQNFVVYVIDNNSNDNGIELVNGFTNKLQIQTIRLSENCGYAKGNNIGLLEGIKDGCGHFFILNPDMELDRFCLENLIKISLLQDDVAIVGPIVLFGSKEQKLVQSYGIVCDFKRQIKVDQYINLNFTENLPEINGVDYAHGGAMLIKASVLSKIGVFHEDYFMYNDELDLGFRIFKAGYKVICVKKAIAYHYHDYSTKNLVGHCFMYYYGIRNKYLYFKRHQLLGSLLLSLSTDILLLPLKIRWARRMGGIKLLKFYYLGLMAGIKGEKGKSNKDFK